MKEHTYLAVARIPHGHYNMTRWDYISSHPAGSIANIRDACAEYCKKFGQRLPMSMLWRVALVSYTPVNKIAKTKHWTYINPPFPDDEESTGGIREDE